MTDRGDDFVFAVQILFNRFRFGRGFDDEEFHVMRCLASAGIMHVPDVFYKSAELEPREDHVHLHRLQSNGAMRLSMWRPSWESAW